MQTVYSTNGLPFFTEQDLLVRKFFFDFLVLRVKTLLKGENKAWEFANIEAPCLIPRELINPNYTDADIFAQQESNLTLKPETTPSSYLVAESLLASNSLFPPLCVYQMSKSFRREDEQPFKFCRFKEFYQLEFQCIYTASTLNDYQEKFKVYIAEAIAQLFKLNVRVVDSDRLPEYSLKTVDVEVYVSDRWMEVCSISLRKDFTYKPIVKGKEHDCLNLEIAIGMDRLIYCFNNQ